MRSIPHRLSVVTVEQVAAEAGRLGTQASPATATRAASDAPRTRPRFPAPCFLGLDVDVSISSVGRSTIRRSEASRSGNTPGHGIRVRGRRPGNTRRPKHPPARRLERTDAQGAGTGAMPPVPAEEASDLLRRDRDRVLRVRPAGPMGGAGAGVLLPRQLLALPRARAREAPPGDRVRPPGPGALRLAASRRLPGPGRLL